VSTFQKADRSSHRLRAAVLGALLATIPIGAALAIDVPTRKAGLWEIIMTSSEGRTTNMSQCVDEATDKLMSAFSNPMMQSMCSRNTFEKTATGYSGESTCTIAGRTVTSRADVIGDFNSAYTVRVTSGGDVGSSGGMTMSARWAGACTADQKPGDMIMPGGVKVNVKDLQALKGMMPKR
jgi:hypothetical protein